MKSECILLWNFFFYLTSSYLLIFYQARISREEASILRSLHSRVFTAQQDGPSQSFGEGMEYGSNIFITSTDKISTFPLCVPFIAFVTVSHYLDTQMPEILV